MDFETLKSVLAANTGVIEKLTQDVTLEQARWKPDPDRWSILEVINVKTSVFIWI